MPKAVKTPPLVVESMGISVPSQEYRIPTFTVPKSYPFRVPLLGKLEVSAGVYSNFYNWTAAYTVTNSTTERATSVKATYDTNADSDFELLAYSVKGRNVCKPTLIILYLLHLLYQVKFIPLKTGVARSRITFPLIL